MSKPHCFQGISCRVSRVSANRTTRARVMVFQSCLASSEFEELEFSLNPVKVSLRMRVENHGTKCVSLTPLPLEVKECLSNICLYHSCPFEKRRSAKLPHLHVVTKARVSCRYRVQGKPKRLHRHPTLSNIGRPCRVPLILAAGEVIHGRYGRARLQPYVSIRESGDSLSD